MSKRSGRYALLLAIGLGLATSFLVWRYVQDTATRAAGPVPMASVVVATRDLPARTFLTTEMLKVMQVPVAAKHPSAITSMDSAVGKVTKVPLTAGEQVLSTKFALEREDSGLSFVVPPSKRAVAISVSEVIGAGGLVLPGDYVDVIAVFEAKTMGKDMATIILQNIEVLAVAQQIQGEVTQPSAPDLSPLNGTNQAKQTAKAQPKAVPTARSVTLAVTPEEAQRLVLAEERGKLRLALRPQQEKTTVNIPEATLGTIRQPVESQAAEITAVSISPTSLKAGDTLRVEITVRNNSNRPLRTSGPNPEYTYIFGQTYHSQNFPSEDGTYRVGINLAGQTPVNFPFRWGFGGDLAPGASTTVVGYIKLTSDMKPTNFWAGLIREPASVVQDNVGATQVAVSKAGMAVIAVDSAQVRNGPSISSGIVASVQYGTELQILGQEGEWYRVKLPDGQEGYVAAGWVART